MAVARSRGLIAAAIATLAAALGCASDGRAHSAPEGTRPGVLALTVSDFQDTDLNRYRDRTTAVVYILSGSSAYPLPIKAAGTFEFKLQTHEGATLATWTFSERDTAEAARQLAPGVGYVFDLNLAKIGAEKVNVREAEILCSFTPTGGEPIRTHPSAPLLVGPVGRGDSGS